MEEKVSKTILDIVRDKGKDRCLNCGEVDEVSTYWENRCNEEGEDYYELSIDCNECAYELFTINGWGAITNWEECIEVLQD